MNESEINQLIEQANDGDLQATLKLIEMYRNGIDVEQNEQIAEQWEDWAEELRKSEESDEINEEITEDLMADIQGESKDFNEDSDHLEETASPEFQAETEDSDWHIYRKKLEKLPIPKLREEMEKDNLYAKLIFSEKLIESRIPAESQIGKEGLEDFANLNAGALNDQMGIDARAEAWSRLGDYYLIRRDDDNAFKAHSSAYELNADYVDGLIECFENGYGCQKNVFQAEKLKIEKAKKLGIVGRYNMAVSLPQRSMHAVELLQMALEAPDADQHRYLKSKARQCLGEWEELDSDGNFIQVEEEKKIQQKLFAEGKDPEVVKEIEKLWIEKAKTQGIVGRYNMAISLPRRSMYAVKLFHMALEAPDVDQHPYLKSRTRQCLGEWGELDSDGNPIQVEEEKKIQQELFSEGKDPDVIKEKEKQEEQQIEKAKTQGIVGCYNMAVSLPQRSMQAVKLLHMALKAPDADQHRYLKSKARQCLGEWEELDSDGNFIQVEEEKKIQQKLFAEGKDPEVVKEIEKLWIEKAKTQGIVGRYNMAISLPRRSMYAVKLFHMALEAPDVDQHPYLKSKARQYLGEWGEMDPAGNPIQVKEEKKIQRVLRSEGKDPDVVKEKQKAFNNAATENNALSFNKQSEFWTKLRDFRKIVFLVFAIIALILIVSIAVTSRKVIQAKTTYNKAVAAQQKKQEKKEAKKAAEKNKKAQNNKISDVKYTDVDTLVKEKSDVVNHFNDIATKYATDNAFLGETPSNKRCYYFISKHDKDTNGIGKTALVEIVTYYDEGLRNQYCHMISFGLIDSNTKPASITEQTISIETDSYDTFDEAVEDFAKTHGGAEEFDEIKGMD